MLLHPKRRRLRGRSRLLAASLLTTAAVIGGVVVAAPAEAAVSNCPSGYACFWKDAGYTSGGVASKNVSFKFLIANFQYWNYGPTKDTGILNGNSNDSASSVYNNGNTDETRWYQGSYSSGYTFTLRPKVGDDNLSNATGAVKDGKFNDKLSSGFFASCDPAYKCS